MNDDQPTAAGQILVQILPVGLLDVAGFLLVEDEDIGFVELGFRRKHRRRLLLSRRAR